ncbi:MAG: diguanylate cyclase [Synergistales bacterium]|nr:diguanylate cyclase [Synergistales bacterium]
MSESFDKPLGNEGTDSVNFMIQKTIRLEKEAARWKREETALRDMERRYLALSENPVFLLAILSGGRVTYLNGRAEAFFGFPLRERPRFLLTDYVAPGYCVEVEKLLEQAGGDELWERRFSFPVLTEGGAERWLDMAVTPVEYRGEPSMLAVGYEIPAPAENEPVAETKIPAGFSCSADNLLAAVTDRDCILQFMTEGFRREAAPMWNAPPETGLSMLELLPEGDRGLPFRLAVEKALSGEGAEIGQEAGDRFFSISFAPVFSPDGQVSGVSLVLCEKTGQRAAERKVRAEEEKFRRLFSLVSDLGIIVTRDEGRIIECNRAFHEKVFPSGERAEGKTLEELGLLPYGALKNTLYSGIGEKGSVRELKQSITLPSGEDLPVLLSAIPLERGGRQVLLLSLRETVVPAVQAPSAEAAPDPSGEKAPQERSRGIDELLGIPDREGFGRLLSTEMERAGRYRGSLSVILMDIDGFRELMEQAGEDGGKKFLRDFFTAVKSRIRPTDFLARLGGGEFAVLTPMSGYLAHQMADKIRDMVCHSHFFPGRGVFCSFGVCEYRREMSNDEFLKRAGIALREAKRAGGNRAVLAPPIP